MKVTISLESVLTTINELELDVARHKVNFEQLARVVRDLETEITQLRDILQTIVQLSGDTAASERPNYIFALDCAAAAARRGLDLRKAS